MKQQLTVSRKRFLRHLGIGATSLILFPSLRMANLRKEPLDPAQVEAFVNFSHGKMDRVKEMLEEQPALLHATWDWGGGDFETAIGAASHVGHRELAEYLLQKGARMNLFTAAMLGNLTLVKAIVEQYPKQLFTKGPHQLSLMHHAKKGGGSALEVVDWLESKGIKD